ncbi:hypothetical protein MANES_18G105550v8 [Manihot esculenta]|uniref:Uncharacterized protein n=6 Tax=Manihot esculenta TaxID=3983 RepID=A0ACB7G3Z9_MANES|nr:hypothetical protein MANES_18G105550v8 [Manihot esculenta]KAG8633442.1 hypothetical protein MANES_18G105550v8 [Manihot esculenta]KAG8633443.1 hypothetical protein MANES_18G105550v8 [Manihot esculenta]KAG8633444.1 hypothetical protein MANES_18G105550v8 [Manihot esculenta]KAG8633445.1 hypothetical protein MANES_18G105550v8 [Manihot esculenta]
MLVASSCVLLLVMFASAGAATDCPKNCNPDGPLVRFPFRLKNSHSYCGYPGFEISCSSNNETVLELPGSVKLFVSMIDYKAQKLHAYDPNGCLPKYLPLINLSASPFLFKYKQLQDFTVFDCSIEPPWTGELYNISCISNYDAEHNVIAFHSHSSINNPFSPSLLSCTKLYNVSLVPHQMLYPNGNLIFNWIRPNCTNCQAEGKLCKLKQNSSQPEIECSDISKQHRGATMRKKVIVIGTTLGLFFLSISLYYVRRSDESEKRIKEFLEDYKALKPTRYTYADIKRITDQFKDFLGEGSYGKVFKGKLSSEILVAVKVLHGTKWGRVYK